MKKQKNGFTLIELIAVLVIMAILALIVTPLVMNIIRKARISADKRSVDAYGRSVELAIATHLLDTGTFPTSIEQLTIEYSGDEVVCSTTQLNSDSTVYLSGCTVGGRSVDYKYGKAEIITYESYSVGDQVKYNNVDYYVIENSDETKDTVTLLKAEPLTYNEVVTFSNGTNAFSYQCGNYGCIGYGPDNTDYAQSYVKTVADNWYEANGNLDDLVNDDTGYGVRLLVLDDFINNLGYKVSQAISSSTYRGTNNTPIWVYNFDWYWTMISDDSITCSEECNQPHVAVVTRDKSLYSLNIYGGYSSPHREKASVRPVITLKKTTDITKLNS